MDLEYTKKYKYQVLTELKSSASKKTKTLTIDYLTLDTHSKRNTQICQTRKEDCLCDSILYALPPIPISDSDVGPIIKMSGTETETN